MEDFVYSGPKTARVCRVCRAIQDEVGKVFFLGSGDKFVIATGKSFECRECIRTTSAFPEIFCGTTDRSGLAKGRSEAGVGMSAREKKLGDEWCMLIK
jgi:hypothetical protein